MRRTRTGSLGCRASGWARGRGRERRATFLFYGDVCVGKWFFFLVSASSCVQRKAFSLRLEELMRAPAWLWSLVEAATARAGARAARPARSLLAICLLLGDLDNA